MLCRVIEPDDAEAAWVVHRGDRVVATLNRYPYTNGHVLILPVDHVERLTDLAEDVSDELWRVTTRIVAAIERAYDPGGVNVGANLGAAAGAGIPGHLHVHALPRWPADTNFMTTIGGTRVVLESLDDTADRLRAAWE